MANENGLPGTHRPTSTNSLFGFHQLLSLYLALTLTSVNLIHDFITLNHLTIDPFLWLIFQYLGTYKLTHTLCY